MGVAGTAVAMETAPVALLTNDLSRLADTIYVGRRCVLKIRQNILFSVTTKLVGFRLDIRWFSWVVASRRRGCRERIDCHFQRHVDFARSQERRYKTKQDFARSRNKICRRRKGKAETVSGAATSTIAPRKFTRTFAFFRRETTRLLVLRSRNVFFENGRGSSEQVNSR